MPHLFNGFFFAPGTRTRHGRGTLESGPAAGPDRVIRAAQGAAEPHGPKPPIASAVTRRGGSVCSNRCAVELGDGKIFLPRPFISPS